MIQVKIAGAGGEVNEAAAALCDNFPHLLCSEPASYTSEYPACGMAQ